MTDAAKAIPPTSPPLSFEEALAQLERIVAELESGQAPLERSIDIYERGAALKAHCEKKLEAARLKVEKDRPGPRRRCHRRSGRVQLMARGPARKPRGAALD
jgi:exodeoxyribonuclease VII small subunit